MKARTRVFSLLGLVLVLIAVLLPVGRAMAQSSDDNRAAALLGGGVMMVVLLIGLAVYVYIALAIQTIANKTRTENSWMAWIPILNIILLLNVAKKPIWWIVLFVIPIVSIVIAIIVWMAVAEARGKPSWWGILLIVPLVGLIVPGYLAWAD
ncbi:MAG TPA: DUF5684 domain-containing protein [Terriglobales bacterium]|jgi:hypothetical protein|nr:DUF5684 domain-containing protein [Terriglobales bacterium]